MGVTPNLLLPYPESTDPADVPTDIHELASAVESALGAIPIVSALPTTGNFDGREILYAADAANGIYWHLRYVAALAAPYRWVFLGGSPLTAQNDTLVQNAGAWSNLSPALTITLPLAGDYMVGHGCGQMDNTGAGFARCRTAINGVGNLDLMQLWGASGNGVAPGWLETRATRVATASGVLSQQYEAGTAGTARFSLRRMLVRPILVA